MNNEDERDSNCHLLILKTLVYNILVNGFLFITIFARKKGLSENMIFDWMLFVELTFKDNSDH